MIQLCKKCKQGVLGQHCWHMLLMMMMFFMLMVMISMLMMTMIQLCKCKQGVLAHVPNPPQGSSSSLLVSTTNDQLPSTRWIQTLPKCWPGNCEATWWEMGPKKWPGNQRDIYGVQQCQPLWPPTMWICELYQAPTSINRTDKYYCFHKFQISK